MPEKPLSVIHCLNLINAHGVLGAKNMLDIYRVGAYGDPRTDPTKAWRYAVGGIAVDKIAELGQRAIAKDPLITELVALASQQTDSQDPEVDLPYQLRANLVISRVGENLNTQFTCLKAHLPSLPDEDLFKQAYLEFEEENIRVGYSADTNIKDGIKNLEMTIRGPLLHIIEAHQQASTPLTRSQLARGLRGSYFRFANPQISSHIKEFSYLRGSLVGLWTDRMELVGYRPECLQMNDDDLSVSIDPDLVQQAKKAKAEDIFSDKIGCLAKLPSRILGIRSTQQPSPYNTIYGIYFQTVDILNKI